MPKLNGRVPDVKFLEMGRDIAAADHEQFDGTGYPNGLAGDRIPHAGRIVSLADVCDALTCTRVYKEAFSHYVARSIILKDSGSHFDPEVVDAFVQNESRFMAIRERLSESEGVPREMPREPRTASVRGRPTLEEASV